MTETITTRDGYPSRYTIEPDDTPQERYKRLYIVRKYAHRLRRDVDYQTSAALAVYLVRDMYPEPVILSRDPENASDLPAYVLARVLVEDARDRLRTYLHPGSTIYTIRRSPRGLGPAHLLDLYAFLADGLDNQPYPLYLTHLAATAAGFSMRHGCIYMGGGGMDLGFAAAEALSWALYGNGKSFRQSWL